MITKNSKAVLYGTQLDVAQRMLDFDYLCGKEQSVVGILSADNRSHKLFFGDKEILLPVYREFKDIPENCDTLINFASFRSAGQVTLDAMSSPTFKNIIVVAEGLPERQTREIITLNQKEKKFLLGPSTVGGILAGSFRIGNTGGSLENIIKSKLYKQGSIGFVSKSGGMANEMFRILSQKTNGIHTGFSIGGDRFPFSTLKDIVLEYEADDEIKAIVLLGELGGIDEIEIGDLIHEQKIKKPVIAWVTGTSAEFLPKELQFGHAGAKANKQQETAQYKNEYLKKCGAHVPDSFSTFGELIASVAKEYGLQSLGEETPHHIQEKYTIIKNRKKSLFTSTISNEKNELLYNNIPISDFCKTGSLARVIGHLWLKKELPDYGIEFINSALILLADHGPAVSGAANVIITARAGKDIVSSLISGLATIGPKFGGAIEDAAQYFFNAVKEHITPEKFVDSMKEKGVTIPGIGHKIKSKYNPDKRCEILHKVSEKFPKIPYLLFALEVEKITLEKKSNLILNVDGYIAAMLLDLMQSLGLTDEEIGEYISSGIFNGIFIIARSIGFIGHAIDQNRLGEGLYRTPPEDILYL